MSAPPPAPPPIAPPVAGNKPANAKPTRHVVVIPTPNLPPVKLGKSDCVPRKLNLQDWSDISSVKRSESGAIGVYFVRCDAKTDNSAAASATATAGTATDSKSQAQLPTVAVLKRTMAKSDYFSDMFANDLAKHCAGLAIPGLRLLSDKELKQVKERLQSLYKGFDDTPIRDICGASLVSLMELVQGSSLKHKSEGQRTLTAADWVKFGRVFAFDLVINNSDRFPCDPVWPRAGGEDGEQLPLVLQGNPGNVMLTDDNVVAIDHSLTAFHYAKEADKKGQSRIEDYIKRVQTVVDEIAGRIADKDNRCAPFPPPSDGQEAAAVEQYATKSPSLSKLVDFFSEVTGIEADEKQKAVDRALLRIGFLQGIDRMALYSKNLQAILKEDTASSSASTAAATAADSKQANPGTAAKPATTGTAAAKPADDKLPVFELCRNLSAVLDVLGRKEQELRAASGVQAARYVVKPHGHHGHHHKDANQLSKPKLDRAKTATTAQLAGAGGEDKPVKQKLSVIDRILLARNRE